ncbi:ATP synthase F1 subunit gamma [Clostridium sp. JN-9]|uniref:ATP synthase F1 subunit gamma n=1 Tax=Clostridium sp. JN-9 TaxID=2507159 RepID=UPI000FFE028F|nr:ATP synthase F1 subunit gamma [Clostridium sp. JN-9]QAT38987.1 F0F1 ATP synthase subunit gamma [Clostridium sp. JN-9]
MAGLIAIRRRIKSITNTRKITNAMGLVATAKLRKTRSLLDINCDYYDSFEETIKLIVQNVENYNIYTHGNESNKELIIVFTSDSGLCGSFNSNAVSEAIRQASENKDNSFIMVVGQKGRAYFKKLKYSTAAEYVGISDLPSLKEARIIAEHALRLYRNGEVGKIKVVYTKFHSAVKQDVLTKKLLPIDFTAVNNSSIILEPEVNTLLEDLSDTYIQQCILNYMLNSKASEQGARMSAMNGATKNANDLLEKLQLKYNRVRQSLITQEISEIVGGAEAQK